MLLHLFSDANYNLLGFNASFRFSLCPGGCSGRGQCRASGVCACEPGWGGPDCSLQECSAYCGSHGTCTSVSLSPAVCPPPPGDHTYLHVPLLETPWPLPGQPSLLRTLLSPTGLPSPPRPHSHLPSSPALPSSGTPPVPASTLPACNLPFAGEPTCLPLARQTPSSHPVTFSGLGPPALTSAC